MWVHLDTARTGVVPLEQRTEPGVKLLLISCSSVSFCFAARGGGGCWLRGQQGTWGRVVAAVTRGEELRAGSGRMRMLPKPLGPSCSPGAVHGYLSEREPRGCRTMRRWVKTLALGTWNPLCSQGSTRDAC